MSDFWARRKAAVAAETKAQDIALLEAERAEVEATQAERTDEELLEELGLPDPDTLDTSAELRAFLLPSIPRRLKTRALRRMWRTNPVLANLDGLVDYAEDYTDAAMVPDVLTTSYQVGRGLTRHVEELARQAANARTDTTEAATAADALDADALDADAPAAGAPAGRDAPEGATATAEPALAQDEDGAIPAATDPEIAADMPARRRIRITFSDPAGETA
ncbi:MAG: hypothetical protein CML66_30725 [Rhodobacteraceae bacterium]|nr:hypothetical protein [Paracoccaceae bacterium]